MLGYSSKLTLDSNSFNFKFQCLKLKKNTTTKKIEKISLKICIDKKIKIILILLLIRRLLARVCFGCSSTFFSLDWFPCLASKIHLESETALANTLKIKLRIDDWKLICNWLILYRQLMKTWPSELRSPPSWSIICLPDLNRSF